jgi:hypothetical protein
MLYVAGGLLALLAMTQTWRWWRSWRARLDVTPVSERWLADRRGTRERD